MEKNKSVEKKKIVGTFQNHRNFGFVVPDDKKVCRSDIFISKNKNMNARNNQKVVVEITKESTTNRKAEGRIVQILGNVNETGVDILSIINEFDLPYEFPKKVLHEAKKVAKEKISLKNRVDLRSEEIFTIDGEDAKDLDDAVNVKKIMMELICLVFILQMLVTMLKTGVNLIKKL